MEQRERGMVDDGVAACGPSRGCHVLALSVL